MSWKVLLNAALFQLTWFACVLGGARGEWLWGAAGVALLGLFSFTQATLARDLRFIAVLVVVGLCLDTIWSTAGVLDYSDKSRPIALFGITLSLAPAWIVILWSGVGLTLMHSLGFFVSRPWLGAIMAGGASVPCYLTGQRFGAVIIPQPYELAFVVSAWSVIFLAMFSWARRVEERHA